MAWFFGNNTNEEAEVKELNDKIAVMEQTLSEKLNPAQEDIAMDQGIDAQSSTRYARSHIDAYNTLEVVNRGVNLIADSVAEFSFDIKDRINRVDPVVNYNRKEKLYALLNVRSSPHITANEFKRSVVMDLLLEGNAFIYFDGNFLYVLPAINVEIKTDKREFINSYKYDDTTFTSDEIIHIRENAADSIFRGSPRLNSAVKSIQILNSMNKYQENFFKNNTILGVVLKTKDMLSNKLKQRKVLEWMRDYNPTTGGRKPLILDGGYELEDLSKYSFKELDFAESIKTQEKKILEALGVPPILLDSGNNANIAPNLKLLYTNTVLPLINKITASMEIYFGFDLKPVTADIMALRPELREESNYYSTLVNAGIMTRNEAREKLRLEEYTDDPDVADALILPANIAGSAVDSSVGGKPAGNNEE